METIERSIDSSTSTQEAEEFRKIHALFLDANRILPEVSLIAHTMNAFLRIFLNCCDFVFSDFSRLA